MCMKEKYQHLAHYLYLVPLFFVIHIGGQFADSIPFYQLLLLALIYIFCFLIIRAGFHFLYKLYWKASLFTFSCQIIFFFFGDFHLYLKKYVPSVWISQYRFLLPLVLLMIIISSISIFRLKRKPVRFILLLNTLFLLFVVSDLVRYYILHASNKMSISHIPGEDDKTEFIHKPSIYLLVLDEYASSSSLKERFSFKNDLDSFLVDHKFHLINNSQSNYNFTPFSIASLLNLAYLDGFQKEKIGSDDYQQILSLIKRNKLVEILEGNGYLIQNRSIFDFEKQPAYSNSPFLPEGLSILRNQTFFKYIYHDIGWILLKYRNVFSGFYQHTVMQTKHHNENVIQEIRKTASSEKKQPVFMYAHLNMPHPPYYYDSLARERPVDSIVYELKNKIENPATYLSYLKYTNNIIKSLVSYILDQEKGNAIIIVAGDHGYRSHITNQQHMFSNMNAIYIPQYLNSDTPSNHMTLVNEFRYIINTISRKQIKLLTDSTILLIDEKPENRDKN